MTKKYLKKLAQRYFKAEKKRNIFFNGNDHFCSDDFKLFCIDGRKYNKGKKI